MARQQICGFETGDGYEGERESSAASTHGLGGTSSVQTSVKYSGDYALRCNPTTTNLGYFIMAGIDSSGRRFYFDQATLYYKFMFRVDTLPAATSEEIFISQDSVPGGKLYVRINSTGNLIAYQSNGTTILATGTTALSLATWYRIDIKVGTGASAPWEVRINGVSEISGTSSSIGSNNNARINLGKAVNRNGNTVDYYFDDVVIETSGYPVDSKIGRLDVTGAGQYLEWGAGAGDGDYRDVDDTPHDSQTTFLMSIVLNQRLSVDCETLAAAGITAGSILSVKPVILCRESAAGTASFQAGLRSASTDDYATAQDSPKGTTYISRGKIYETDPATSAAWTASGVDAAQPLLRYTEVAGIVAINCTSMCLMVEYVPGGGGGAGKAGGAGKKGGGGGKAGKSDLFPGGAQYQRRGGV